MTCGLSLEVPVLELVTPYLPVSCLKADVERNSLLTAGNSVAAEEKKGKTVKAALYGVQVFYSFFIM
jgi:hypothetical protein